MRNTILRILYSIAVFAATVLLLEKFAMNEADAVRESPLSGPHLAIVSIEEEGREFNVLQGLTGEIDPGKYRSVLTPAGTDRTVRFAVNPFGEGISGISYEVRSLDGKRLIENGTVSDIEVDEKGILHSSVVLKDLIENGQEYLFVLQVLTARADPAKYWTRVICSDSQVHSEALNFVREFHENSLDKSRESYFRTYLETQGSEEQDLSETDLYSSPEELTFYSLEAEDLEEPAYSVDSVRGNTVVLHSEGILSLKDETGTAERKAFYREYYRVRKGAERFFLIDYRRTLEEIPDLKNIRSGHESFELGITSHAGIRTAPSGGAGTTAFVSCGNLYLYYSTDNELVSVYGFGDEEIRDRREMDRLHDIRILDIDGSGNISFLVYGYMSSGQHEGRTGISVCRYTHAGRSLSEQAFIEYDGSYEMLRTQIENTAYLQQGGKLYLMLDRQFCALDTLTGAVEAILPEVRTGEIWSSESGRYAAWITEGDKDVPMNITLLDFEDLTRKTIEAGQGEKLIPVGFRGDDFIYGTAALEDATKDQIGTAYYPMFNIRIVDFGLHILTDYQEENILISDCEETQTQIILHRLIRTVDETGAVVYEPTEDDQIMKTTASSGASTQALVQQDAEFGRLVSVPLKGFSLEGLRLTGSVSSGGSVHSSDFLLADSQNGSQQETEIYYLYGTYGYENDYTDESEAVRRAALSGAAVVDRSGRYIWEQPSQDRCQLTGFRSELGSDSPAAACLDALLKYEGYYSPAAADPEAGVDAAAILAEAGREKGLQVLQLTGCSFDSILYYPSAGSAVLAVTAEEDGAVLVLGYGPEKVALYDPANGGEILVTREEARALCEGGGNRYITYIK